MKDDPKPSASKGTAQQLVAIEILFVPSNLKVGEETLNRFRKGYIVLGEFVPLEVVLKIGWGKAVPVDHALFYSSNDALVLETGPTWRSGAVRFLAAACSAGLDRVIAYRTQTLHRLLDAVDELNAQRLLDSPGFEEIIQ